jgi:hypothetical protein
VGRRQGHQAVNAIGKNRVVLAGLWTSACIVGPALSALDQGYEVCVIADAFGDVSNEAHDRAMDRMVQAGAQSILPPTRLNRAVSKPQMPCGAKMTKAMNISPKNSPHFGVVTRLVFDHEKEHRAQDRPDQRTGTPDNDHDQDLAGKQPEHQLGVGKPGKRRIKSAGKTTERVGESHNTYLVKTGL